MLEIKAPKHICANIKSIYRKHSEDGKISAIHLRLVEPADHYIFTKPDSIEYINNLGLKKGELITVHFGCGVGHLCIDKGNTMCKNTTSANPNNARWKNRRKRSHRFGK